MHSGAWDPETPCSLAASHRLAQRHSLHNDRPTVPRQTEFESGSGLQRSGIVCLGGRVPRLGACPTGSKLASSLPAIGATIPTTKDNKCFWKPPQTTARLSSAFFSFGTPAWLGASTVPPPEHRASTNFYSLPRKSRSRSLVIARTALVPGLSSARKALGWQNSVVDLHLTPLSPLPFRRFAPLFLLTSILGRAAPRRRLPSKSE